MLLLPNASAPVEARGPAEKTLPDPTKSSGARTLTPSWEHTSAVLGLDWRRRCPILAHESHTSAEQTHTSSGSSGSPCRCSQLAELRRSHGEAWFTVADTASSV